MHRLFLLFATLPFLQGLHFFAPSFLDTLLPSHGVHFSCPFLLKVPGRHFLQAFFPFPKNPGRQVRQRLLLLFASVPGLQGTHEDDPSSEINPALQRRHLLAPSIPTNLPAGQGVQLGDPVPRANVPT